MLRRDGRRAVRADLPRRGRRDDARGGAAARSGRTSFILGRPRPSPVEERSTADSPVTGGRRRAAPHRAQPRRCAAGRSSSTTSRRLFEADGRRRRRDGLVLPGRPAAAAARPPGRAAARPAVDRGAGHARRGAAERRGAVDPGACAGPGRSPPGWRCRRPRRDAQRPARRRRAGRACRYRGGSDDIDLDRTAGAARRAPGAGGRRHHRAGAGPDPAQSVVLLVDVSGSMRGERVRTAAATVGALAGELSRDDLAVIAFWSDAAIAGAPRAARAAAGAARRRCCACRPRG